MLGSLTLWVLIALALINGVNIICNRVLNAKLGVYIGHLRSSFWNHLIGALFLFPLLFLFSPWQTYWQQLDDIPILFYTGGLLGVVFVWMLNWVIPRLGALKATLILLASQMTCGLVLDVYIGKIKSLPMAVLGISLILVGALIGKVAKRE